MKDLKEKLIKLNELIQQGRLVEGIDQFYHDEVIMQENESTPTLGKAANREREQKFLNDVMEFRKGEVLGIAIGEGLSTVIWHFDYTHREWGVRNYKQVSVQRWKDGLIIHEQFFYGS